MKNKKQSITNQNSQQEDSLFVPDNPTLNSYYISILQFLNKINLEDSSFSFNDELAEIIDETAKVSRHDSNSLNPAVLDANWRSLSNQILFHVQQINQRNQSSKILQYVAAIKEIIAYTNEVPPIAQAAKKEHHNVYLIMKKAISHIEQSVQLNDIDRTSLLLHNFKNDLPKTYTKFFQLSQLDRAASIDAAQNCKKNVDQILRILAGTNQLYVPPIEFQNLSRFINQLKLKFDTKKPLNSQRSKTPPARIPKSSYQRNYFTNTIAFTPPALAIPVSPDNLSVSRKYPDSPSSARKVRTSKYQVKEIVTPSNYKTVQASNDKIPSRSRTPPSKILSSTFSTRSSRFSPSNIPTRRNITIDSNKNNESIPHQNQRKSSKSQLGTTALASLPSTKNRKTSSQQQNNSNFTEENDIENDFKMQSKRKSDPSSATNSYNETQKRKSRSSNNSSSRKSPPLSPISILTQQVESFSKKNLNHTQNLNAPQNFNHTQNLVKKKDQGGNLISTAVNIDRSILQGSTSSEGDPDNIINLKSASKIPKSQSSLSQDSETDQLVMAVIKAKEQVKHLSPTLEKLQRDLSGLFYKDDSTSPLSPSSDPPDPSPLSKRSVQKINDINQNSNDNEDSIDVEIDIDEAQFSPRYKTSNNRDEMKSKTIHSFDSRQCSSVSKYSLTTIESCYQEFLNKLNQFDNLIKLGQSIKKFSEQIKEGDKESRINSELALSKIDEAIASHHSGALIANEASLQIGRALSLLNRKLDEVETVDDSIINDYEQILQMIESYISTNTISGSQQTNKLFMQTIKTRKAEFEAARPVIQSIQKRDIKSKKKMKSQNSKNRKKKEGEEEEIANANKLLEDEIEKLNIELSNLNNKEKLKSSSNLNDDHFTENLIDFDVDEKLNKMSFNELDHVRNELANQLSEIQKQHECQLLQFKKTKEDSIRKINESKSELSTISKQISEANKSLSCSRNKTVEFQSKTIQKDELQEILMNMIEKENQIIHNIISNS